MLKELPYFLSLENLFKPNKYMTSSQCLLLKTNFLSKNLSPTLNFQSCKTSLIIFKFFQSEFRVLMSITCFKKVHQIQFFVEINTMIICT
jgi:hypothetical protein